MWVDNSKVFSINRDACPTCRPTSLKTRGLNHDGIIWTFSDLTPGLDSKVFFATFETECEFIVIKSPADAIKITASMHRFFDKLHNDHIKLADTSLILQYSLGCVWFVPSIALDCYDLLA